jgi:integrase
MATVFLHPKRKTYYHRAQIPKKLRRHFRGRVELWRSLKTEDKDEAKLKSLQWETRAQRVFLTLKRHGATMSPLEIDALIERWMDAELEVGEDHRATHPVTEEWLFDTAMIRVSQMEDLNEDLGRCNYHRVEHDADEILKAAGLPPLAHDSVEFKRLCRKLILAKMDLLSIETDRWKGVYQDRKVNAAPATVVAPPVKKSPLFSVIAKKYLAENPRARRTADQVRVELDKFLKAIGGDRPIASITKNEGRTYKEHLIQGRGVSLATVAKHLHTLSGLFTWAEKQGFMNEGAPNPVKGLAPSKTESEKSATDIRPFTDEELLRVFSSTNFLDQKAPRPDRYWITLLCLFQLCRREEAAQLALTDIGAQDGIPFIVITDLGEDQSLKNKGSKRKMPIHSSLVSLGFLDYVRGLKDQGESRLFPQLQLRANGYSDAVGKFFARHLDKLKLSEPELVMHSLRHGIHYLHALGCPQDVAEMLTGHSATSVHDKVYAHRNLTPLTRLRDGLEKMQFPAVLTALAQEDNKP